MSLLLASALLTLATAQQPAFVCITPSDPDLPVGAAMQLGATVIDSRGNALKGRTVTWTSSAPTVVPVSPTGLVIDVAHGGSATITATSEGKSGSAQVTVPKPKSKSLRPSIERGLEGIGLGCTVLASCPEYLRRVWNEYRWRTRARIGFLSIAVLAAPAIAWFLMWRRRRVRAA